MEEINPLSLATTPIEIIASVSGVDKIVTTGTGFFLSESHGNINFFTNWHLLTGRVRTNPSLSKIKGAIPYKIKCNFHQNIGQPHVLHTNKICTLEIVINDHMGESPNWLEHPKYRFETDVVCIKIQKKSLEKVIYNLLSEYKNFHKDYVILAMDDIHVIGYPWGLSGGNGVLPIFKSGSIASEPNVNFHNLPCLLIDCRTTKGMSGSPVIAKRSGILMVPGPPTSQLVGTFSKFLGIYSGRLESQTLLKGEEISEIGIVWKESVMHDIINNGVKGTPLSKLIS